MTMRTRLQDDQQIRQGIIDFVRRRGGTVGAQSIIAEMRKRNAPAPAVSKALLDLTHEGLLDRFGPHERSTFSLSGSANLPYEPTDDAAALPAARRGRPPSIEQRQPPKRRENIARRHCSRCEREIARNAWKNHTIACYGVEVPWDWTDRNPPIIPQPGTLPDEEYPFSPVSFVPADESWQDGDGHSYPWCAITLPAPIADEPSLAALAEYEGPADDLTPPLLTTPTTTADEPAEATAAPADYPPTPTGHALITTLAAELSSVLLPQLTVVVRASMEELMTKLAEAERARDAAMQLAEEAEQKARAAQDELRALRAQLSTLARSN